MVLVKVPSKVEVLRHICERLGGGGVDVARILQDTSIITQEKEELAVTIISRHEIKTATAGRPQRRKSSPSRLGR